MNRNKTKNFISYLVKLVLLVVLVISVVCVIIALILEDHQRVTAIATTILALTAAITFVYARRQLDLMKRNNEANYIQQIIKLKNDMSAIDFDLYDSRKKFLEYYSKKNKITSDFKIDPNKLDKKGNGFYGAEKKLSHMFYDKLNDLCLYILTAQKSRRDKVFIRDINIHELVFYYFKKIWTSEKSRLELEFSKNEYIMIKKLFTNWNISE